MSQFANSHFFSVSIDFASIEFVISFMRYNTLSRAMVYAFVCPLLALLTAISFLTTVKASTARVNVNIEHLKVANERLEQYFIERSKAYKSAKYSENLPLVGLLGPTLDGTYYYRLGSEYYDDSNGGLSIGNSLISNVKKALIAKGFPPIQKQELFLIGRTSYRARRLGAPHLKFCVKHFPGGDEKIEITESEPMNYSRAQSVFEYMEPFFEVIQSSYPPFCVMLGHSSYPAEAFKAEKDQYLGALLGDFPFEELPASLNPGITK